MNKQTTKLEKLQKNIDRCNGKSGCNSCCSKADQEICPKLRAHAERIAECRERGDPVWLW